MTKNAGFKISLLGLIITPVCVVTANAQVKKSQKIKQSNTLSINDYMELAKQKNPLVKSYEIGQEGFSSRVESAEIDLSPVITGSYVNTTDQSRPSQLGTRREAEIYTLGVAKKTITGTTFKLDAQTGEYVNDGVIFQGFDMYSTGAVNLTVQQSLWKDFFGHGTRNIIKRKTAQAQLEQLVFDLEARATRIEIESNYWDYYLAIEDLKLKILEILDREGKSLVALNTMLCAGDINEQLVQRKMEIREDAANRIIWNGVMTKAVAIALNPITVIDILSGAVIDVVMILTLSKVYGIAMTEAGAVELLQKIAISMGGITAGELIANFGLSSLKGLLGLATPATGGLALGPYFSVAVTQAAIGGVSCYGIGQVTKAYLANGASWGDDGPKAVVTKILSSLDEDSILNRIKDELRAKLNLGDEGRGKKEEGRRKKEEGRSY